MDAKGHGTRREFERRHVEGEQRRKEREGNRSQGHGTRRESERVRKEGAQWKRVFE